MMCDRIVLAALFLIFSGCLVFGEEKPPVIKEGGSTKLWKEKDVKRYMDFPHLISVDDIARKIEATPKIGDYKIARDPNRPLKQKPKDLDVIAFELGRESGTVFRVTVFDYRRWNAEGDLIFIDATTGVDMWSTIPDYFKIKKTDDAYVVTRVGGNSMKAYFHLRSHFILLVKPAGAVEDQGQMDQVIRLLVELIEAKDAEVKEASTRDDGQENK